MTTLTLRAGSVLLFANTFVILMAMSKESGSARSKELSKVSDSPGTINEQAVAAADKPGNVAIKKPSAKKLIVALVILLLIVGATFMAMPADKKPVAQNIQFSNQYFTSGYVTYDPAKLQAVNTTAPEIAPPLEARDDNKKQVIFVSDLASERKRLIMYDVTSYKTYVIAEHDTVANYQNPTIMSDNFVAFAELTQTDPLNHKTAVRIFNLQTGDVRTIMEGPAGELPPELCCSVSTDGRSLAVPGQNKLTVYKIGDEQPLSYEVSVNIFPAVAGNDQDNFAAAERNAGYPKVVWLDDARIMYAKSHPSSWRVDDQGSQISRADNGLAIYDTNARRSVDVPRTFDAAIRWFTVDGGSLLFSDYSPILDSLTIYKITDFESENSLSVVLTDAPDYQSRLSYDANSKKLYIQPSGSSLEQDMGIVKQLDTVTGQVEEQRLSNFKFPHIEGVIGPGKLIINESQSVNNNYNIYNVSDNTFQHIFSFAEEG